MEEKKKNEWMYIQVPIAGRDYDEAKKEALQRALIAENAGFQAMTPFYVIDDPNAPTGEAMGKCIGELLSCDAILAHPWAKRDRRGEEGAPYSKGCALELLAAAIYGVKIYELNDDGDLEPATVIARSAAAKVLYDLAEHLLVFMSTGSESLDYHAKGDLLRQATMVAEVMIRNDKTKAIHAFTGMLADTYGGKNNEA